MEREVRVEGRERLGLKRKREIRVEGMEMLGKEEGRC